MDGEPDPADGARARPSPEPPPGGGRDPPARGAARQAGRGRVGGEGRARQRSALSRRARGPRARAHRRRPARPRPAAGLGARGRGRRPPGSSARALPRRRGGPHRLEVRRADARRPGGPSPRALDEVDREPAPGRPRRDPRGPAARVPALGLRRPGVPDRRARAARGGFEDAAGAAHGRERPRARCGPAREDAARRRRRRPLRDAGGGRAGPHRPHAARRRARGHDACSSTKRTRPAA